MKNEEFKNIVYEVCDKNFTDKSIFYVANICNGENITYDFSNKKEGIKEKFIIRYFSKYDAVVIWKRNEHKPMTRKITLNKKDLKKCIDKDSHIVKKGVEYQHRKLTDAYVSKLEDIEKIILECTK